MSLATVKLPPPSPSQPRVSRSKKSLSNIPYIEVSFIDGLSTTQVVDIINVLPTPQIILWYIGCYGLKEAGVEFYRNYLISPILSQNPEANFWLLDLTAWSAFKTSQCSIRSSSSCCRVLENLGEHGINCIRSSDLFKRMETISDKTLTAYLKKALHRNFISQKSRAFPPANIKIKDVFSKESPLISSFKEKDTNKAYSIFQYLEGCLLVEKIFLSQIENKAEDIEIVFALPNDELEYYRDSAHSFKKDIEFLLSNHCEKRNIQNVRIHIHFLSFQYGLQLQDRPYNAPGTAIRKPRLSYEKIAGQNDTVYSEERTAYAACLE